MASALARSMLFFFAAEPEASLEATTLQRLQQLNERADTSSLRKPLVPFRPKPQEVYSPRNEISTAESSTEAFLSILEKENVPSGEVLKILCALEAEDLDAALAQVPRQHYSALAGVALYALEEGTSEEVACVLNVLPYMRSILAPAMEEVLRQNSFGTRRHFSAVYVLGKLGEQGAVEKLSEYIERGTEEQKCLAGEVLTQMSYPDLLPLWERLLSSETTCLQYHAVRGLQRVGIARAFAVLHRFCVDAAVRAYPLQAAAVDALAEAPAAVAVPYLVDIVEKNGALRKSAAGWLRRITGMNLGDSPKEWQEWYHHAQKVPPLVPSGSPTDAPSELLSTVPFVPPDFQPGVVP